MPHMLKDFSAARQDASYTTADQGAPDCREHTGRHDARWSVRMSRPDEGQTNIRISVEAAVVVR